MAKPELLAHVKFGRLQRALGLRRYEAVGVLETLWHHCWSCSDAEVGTADDVAWIVDWPADDAARLADGLLAAGFLDRDDADQLVVHDLWEHAPSYAKKRAARWDPKTDPDKVSPGSGSPFRTVPVPKEKNSAADASPLPFEADDDGPQRQTAAVNERVLARLCHEIDPIDRLQWADTADALKAQAGRYGLAFTGRAITAVITRVAYAPASPFAHLVRTGNG